MLVDMSSSELSPDAPVFKARLSSEESKYQQSFHERIDTNILSHGGMTEEHVQKNYFGEAQSKSLYAFRPEQPSGSIAYDRKVEENINKLNIPFNRSTVRDTPAKSDHMYTNDYTSQKILGLNDYEKFSQSKSTYVPANEMSAVPNFLRTPSAIPSGYPSSRYSNIVTPTPLQIPNISGDDNTKNEYNSGGSYMSRTAEDSTKTYASNAHLYRNNYETNMNQMYGNTSSSGDTHTHSSNISSNNTMQYATHPRTPTNMLPMRRPHTAMMTPPPVPSRSLMSAAAQYNTPTSHSSLSSPNPYMSNNYSNMTSYGTPTTASNTSTQPPPPPPVPYIRNNNLMTPTNPTIFHHTNANAQQIAQLQQESADGHIYQVHFKRAHRHFLLSYQALLRPIKIGDFVKVEADRGEDMGIVISKVLAAEFSEYIPTAGYRGRGFSSGQGEKKFIIRLASPEERASLIDKVRDEEKALEIIREKIIEKRLPMVVLDAEYQFDRHKLIYFFEADRRIDFRDLVSDLFSLYKTRIWMQQVDTTVLPDHEIHTEIARSAGFLVSSYDPKELYDYTDPSVLSCPPPPSFTSSSSALTSVGGTSNLCTFNTTASTLLPMLSNLSSSTGLPFPFAVDTSSTSSISDSLLSSTVTTDLLNTSTSTTTSSSTAINPMTPYSSIGMNTSLAGMSAAAVSNVRSGYSTSTQGVGVLPRTPTYKYNTPISATTTTGSASSYGYNMTPMSPAAKTIGSRLSSPMYSSPYSQQSTFTTATMTPMTPSKLGPIGPMSPSYSKLGYTPTGCETSGLMTPTGSTIPSLIHAPNILTGDAKEKMDEINTHTMSSIHKKSLSSLSNLNEEESLEEMKQLCHTLSHPISTATTGATSTVATTTGISKDTVWGTSGHLLQGEDILPPPPGLSHHYGHSNKSTSLFDTRMDPKYTCFSTDILSSIDETKECEIIRKESIDDTDFSVLTKDILVGSCSSSMKRTMETADRDDMPIRLNTAAIATSNYMARQSDHDRQIISSTSQPDDTTISRVNTEDRSVVQHYRQATEDELTLIHSPIHSVSSEMTTPPTKCISSSTSTPNVFKLPLPSFYHERQVEANHIPNISFIADEALSKSGNNSQHGTNTTMKSTEINQEEIKNKDIDYSDSNNSTSYYSTTNHSNNNNKDYPNKGNSALSYPESTSSYLIEDYPENIMCTNNTWVSRSGVPSCSENSQHNISSQYIIQDKFPLSTMESKEKNTHTECTSDTSTPAAGTTDTDVRGSTSMSAGKPTSGWTSFFKRSLL